MTENEFSQKCGNSIKDFEKDYCKIKNNCALYSKGSEAAYVSYLYSKYSFVKIAEDIIVLDIEISLEVDEDESRKQDRIGHGLQKKSKRILRSNILIAKKRMIDFQVRHNEGKISLRS